MIEIIGKIAIIHLLAVMTPGPDFFIVLRNTLIYNKRMGILTALGIGTGIVFHASYSLLGLGVVLLQWPLLYKGVSLLGGSFIIYIGARIILETFRESSKDKGVWDQEKADKELSGIKAYRLGLLTNILNPKAGLYFISVFSQFIHEDTVFKMKMMMGIEVILLTTAYFVFVAIFMSRDFMKNYFSLYKKSIERFLGFLLILFGGQLLWG